MRLPKTSVSGVDVTLPEIIQEWHANKNNYVGKGYKIVEVGNDPQNGKYITFELKIYEHLPKNFLIN